MKMNGVAINVQTTPTTANNTLNMLRLMAGADFCCDSCTSFGVECAADSVSAFSLR